MPRSFHTDARGAYSFTGLAFGRYRLEISKSGFATRSVSIDVPSAVPVTRVVTMTLAASAFQMEVVATTPLAGVDLAREEIAAPVQTAHARDVQDSGALDLSDFLNRRLNGVYVNEMQGNPFQPDVNYRGYTASPLLGTPEGISVYLDGVRQNQPFGDVVSWDLIPRVAISEIDADAGVQSAVRAEHAGRRAVGRDQGRPQPSGHVAGGERRQFRPARRRSSSRAVDAKGLSWYVAGNLFHEDGWRDSSPSDVRQFFGKLGWRKAQTDRRPDGGLSPTIR